MFGTIAATRLLSMIVMTFAFVVIISNVITTFSTFFLAEDLEIVLSSPVPARSLYTARFLETMADSSWMVLVFGLPVFLAYGNVFEAPWSFYVLTVICLICLLMLTTALAIFLVQALVKIFPLRRLRDLFVFIGILVFIGVYLLFRMIRPEEFLNPEGFASMMDYMSVMSEPASPLLPTTWILETLRPYITGYGFNQIPFYLGLLVTGSYGAYRLAGHYHEYSHGDGYSRAFESRGARLSRSKFLALYTKALHACLDRTTARLVVKETLLMARDWGRLSQVLLLAALIVVYLYNFTALPSLDNPAATRFLKNTVAFLNIGLAGFVLASLGVRFLFPAISFEGRAFWVLKGSPVPLERILWVKFFFYLAPMLFLGLFLVIMTNRLLELEMVISAICTVTVTLLTIGITSLSIGMGVVHADLRNPDPSRAFTGFGALLTMIYAGLTVAGVILLEAYPVYKIVTAQWFERTLRGEDYLAISVCLAGAGALIAFLIVRPMQMGLRRIRELEI
jgi:ABC-2 type transport system permease protein